MTRTGLVLALGLAATACGGDDDGAGGAGETVTVDISAEAGGEIEIGDATLTIPPGALAEDTTITVTTSDPESLPGSETLTGLAYDFGPDGTTFLVPVTLALPMVGSLGEGQEAVVSWLDEDRDTWEDVPSSVASGRVAGEIEHFTTFIVRFRDATGPVSCEFSACGGDIVGTYDITGVCAVTAEGDGIFDSICPEAIVEIVFDGSGTISFNEDMTYEGAIQRAGEFDVSFPESCANVCVALGESEGATCTSNAGGGCDCTGTFEPDPDDASGTYVLDGSSITMTENPGQGEEPSPQSGEYCRDGNTLSVRMINARGSVFTYSGTRQ